MTRIAVLADYDSAFDPHARTDDCLEIYARRAPELSWSWISSAHFAEDPRKLDGYDGVWIGPGGFSNPEAGLTAIRSVRESGVPVIATCGGSQHALVEYARNVAARPAATHAGYGDDGSPIIEELACSLRGLRMRVTLEPDTPVARAYGATAVDEEYYCRFGLRRDFEGVLEAAGLAVVGRSEDGDARILLDASHSLYLLTVFVPQLNMDPQTGHPLISLFLEAAGGTLS